MLTRAMASAFLLITAACATAPSTREPAAPAGASAPSEPGRTLVAAVRVEPLTLAERSLREQGVAVYLSSRMFNADLAILDDTGTPRPYLVEAFPQLNTDSWQVFPDGRMQTSYHLKPNLTWHDGEPLTADDWVFSWRVYSTPELGAIGRPMSVIDEVSAPDARTIMITWRQPYPDAESFTTRDAYFPALPRHILESTYADGQWDAFVNHPFWTTEYIGLGPFRLDRWEPGAFYEAVPFAGHVNGPPKIQRIKVLFISNSNTALANMLSGVVQLSADTSIRTAEVSILRREWGPDGGTVILHPNQWRAAFFQFRPDVLTQPALMDLRVRKALAMTVNKDPINEAVYEGNSLISNTMIPPLTETGKAIDRAITKHTYDPRAAEQLLEDAGFRRGADGIYTSPSFGRFHSELATNAATDNEAELAILDHTWTQFGLEMQQNVVGGGLERDNQLRATFPGIWVNNTSVGEPALLNHMTVRIPKAENRWQGGNRGGWSNPDFDRLADAYATTLDRAERLQQLVDMAKLQADQLPAISLFFVTQPWAFVSGLTGPKLVAGESNMSWNIETWEFR
ncbi:MAG TPA: ABC transporter substrate-binding protein [Chloroflexota bacterium]|nr:ABC transporter substrate-binding protein [Chloroflexota bacterium]